MCIHTMEPLLKDTLNKGHNVSDLLWLIYTCAILESMLYVSHLNDK